MQLTILSLRQTHFPFLIGKSTRTNFTHSLTRFGWSGAMTTFNICQNKNEKNFFVLLSLFSRSTNMRQDKANRFNGFQMFEWFETLPFVAFHFTLFTFDFLVFSFRYFVHKCWSQLFKTFIPLSGKENKLWDETKIARSAEKKKSEE